MYQNFLIIIPSRTLVVSRYTNLNFNPVSLSLFLSSSSKFELSLPMVICFSGHIFFHLILSFTGICYRWFWYSIVYTEACYIVFVINERELNWVYFLSVTFLRGVFYSASLWDSITIRPCQELYAIVPRRYCLDFDQLCKHIDRL